MRSQRHLLLAISILASLVTAAIAAPRPTLAHDYIVNGSFEGGVDGWTLLSPGSSLDTAADSVPPIAGARRARIVLDQQAFRVSQSLADVPPGNYRLTLWIQQNAGMSGGTYVEVGPASMCSNNCRTDAPNLGGEWHQLSLEVVLASGGFITIRVGGQGSTSDVIYIDDVRFEGAPPATMTPTYTATPLPPTLTPIPPSPTKTPKATSTAKPDSTPTSVVAAQAAPPSAQLANAGFDAVVDGSPQGWQKYGGALTAATSPVRSGSHAARLESTTESTKWLYQTVLVTGGAVYSFDAWLLHHDPNTASAFLRVSWYATADGSGESIGTADSLSRLDAPAPEWRFLTTGGITAPPEARSAKLRVMLQPGSASCAALYVDDAHFAPADPATSAPPAPVIAEIAPTRTDRSSARDASSAPERRAVRPLAASASSSLVLINEVLYDAVGPGDDAHGEWVELYNPGDQAVSLDGWLLADQNKSTVLLTGILIPARSYVVLAASHSLAGHYPGFSSEVFVVGRLGDGLGNDGDLVAILDPSGRFVDAVSWGDNLSAMRPAVADVPAGHSIERRSSLTDANSATDFVDNEAPSPGRPYADRAQAAAPVTASRGSVEILSGESALFGDSLAWLIAAGAVGALCAVAAWRVFPTVAQRLRHQ